MKHLCMVYDNMLAARLLFATALGVGLCGNEYVGSPCTVAAAAATVEPHWSEHGHEDEQVAREQCTDDPQDVGESENNCIDEKEDCLFWAEQGECEENPRYMLWHCRKSCDSCGSKHCVRDPNEAPALEAGGLNVLFERTITGLKTLGLSPAIVSRDPWIITVDHFLSEQECDGLVAQGVKQGFERSGELRTGDSDSPDEIVQVQDEHRTSETAFCTDECHETPVVTALRERVSSLLGISEVNFEFIQLVRYGIGQYYRQHHDSSPAYVHMPMGPRILTMFFYLNNPEGGGETDFPNIKQTVKPRKGRAVLWANVFGNNPMDLDSRTEHAALPIESGLKYGANFWIYQFDYQNPWQLGCTG